MFYFAIRIFLSMPIIIRHGFYFAKTFLVGKSLSDKAAIYTNILLTSCLRHMTVTDVMC